MSNDAETTPPVAKRRRGRPRGSTDAKFSDSVTQPIPYLAPEDFSAALKAAVLELYSVGASDTEVRVALYRIGGPGTERQWELWLENHSEFRETIRVGRLMARAFFDQKGRENLERPNFNAQHYRNIMMFRYGVSERVEHSADGELLTMIGRVLETTASRGRSLPSERK